MDKSKAAQREEEILKFWEENKIFEKTLEKKSPEGEFVFYEGPPTANGKPGIHHLEARAFKDLIPRFKTMQGYHVRRKGGWDTHGLPVELQVEKQLGLKSKKEIEAFGVAEFNKKCKESVWEYVDLWEKFTKRIGYWIDSDHPYVTYKNEYIESLWNILKHIDSKKLLYKDYKVVPWCPRCGTALSSHELAQGYETVKDLSVYVKFELEDEPNTYILAWTTTPWTLPGNVALAVGEKIHYVKIKKDSDFLILAKERLSVVEGEYEVVEELKGKDLVGKKYKPLYDFLKKSFEVKDKEAFEKAYKVYVADFVTTEDGTGVVHTAVMYGQDDFVLGTKVGLPKYHLVNEDGTFKEEAGFLAGKFVKDEETAVEIIKDLAHRNLLFKKEKYEHTYPHCWRCKTPLIYYARDSWYIRMSELRDELVSENEKINWEPAHIKEGRFGEWLREIKDWAISRERYWGTPLPMWQNNEGKRCVVGSIDELKKRTRKSGNTYTVLRHGQAEHNVLDVCSSDPHYPHHLTEKGVEQVVIATENLKQIDLIIHSPFVRAKETAKIVAEKIGVEESNIIEDERIGEFKFGDFHLKPFQEYLDFRKGQEYDLDLVVPGGESLSDAKKRFGDFLYDLEERYQGKHVLLVTHGIGFQVLPAIIEGAEGERSQEILKNTFRKVPEAAMEEMTFVPLPHNDDYELDLHRPYIDHIRLVGEEGEELTRVKEVMDVWFDSGAMPFAQDHYPFSTEDILYPADYIAEAIDQTRGWFYTLLAVGVLMGRGTAYKNVVCLGHILDAQGKKMSKSLGNIVDPWTMIDRYGVDALRIWMYSVNQPGDSKNFDEKTVDEIVKKVFNILNNALSFYLMYADKTVEPKNDSKNVLDRWIISRLNEMLKRGTDYLERYKIFEATRLIRDFANDFSTWYVRRSRDRFKSDDSPAGGEDKKNALSTTLFVLQELSKYMAPFTPFFAEDIYLRVRRDNDPESVHLTGWPKGGKVHEDILVNMEEVRRIVSLGLEKRNSASIKVRQPLGKLKIKSEKLAVEDREYIGLIQDEVNVKEVVLDRSIGNEVDLDTHITEELKQEGEVRDIIRLIQDVRKTQNLIPNQKINIQLDSKKKGIVEAHRVDIMRPTNTLKIEYTEGLGEEVRITDVS